MILIHRSYIDEGDHVLFCKSQPIHLYSKKVKRKETEKMLSLFIDEFRQCERDSIQAECFDD
jgi:hypothetical protein